MATSKSKTPAATRKPAASGGSATKGASRSRATTSKSTATKATATTRKTVKAAPKKPAAADPVAKTADPVAAAAAAVKPEMAELRKRGLIGAVAERSGVKRRDAKAAVEAALEVLGEAIADGRALNLPGLGKVKVTRTKKHANAQVFVTKVRQATRRTQGGGDGSDPDKGPKDPLAEAAE